VLLSDYIHTHCGDAADCCKSKGQTNSPQHQVFEGKQQRSPCPLQRRREIHFSGALRLQRSHALPPVLVDREIEETRTIKRIRLAYPENHEAHHSCHADPADHWQEGLFFLLIFQPEVPHPLHHWQQQCQCDCIDLGCGCHAKRCSKSQVRPECIPDALRLPHAHTGRKKRSFQDDHSHQHGQHTKSIGE